MATPTSSKASASVAALALFFLPSSWSQTSAPPQRLDPVLITSKSAPVLDAEQAALVDWGQSLYKTPKSVTVLGSDLLTAHVTSRLTQAIRFDASLADSYNTTGYLESLSVRGFLLDQANNFQRNGLPVSNMAPIALENKERIEVLKGVAGLQQGVSAPGGLINLVTKRPQRASFTTLSLGADGNAGSSVHVDSNAAWGESAVRVNWVSERLRTDFEGANGQRELASLAWVTRVAPDTTLSADLEYHRKSQPSVPGLGLLDTDGDGVGETLPATGYGRLNLNNQPWSQPFVASSSHLQLALEQQLSADWQARLSLGAQRIRIDDRLAFPDGCSSAAVFVYPGLCGNGDVDIYDYRSEGERRAIWAWDARLQGKWMGMGVSHRLAMGMSGRENRTDLAPRQAYNYVGTTHIDSPTPLPADASQNELNSNSAERATDAWAALSSNWTPTLQSYVGLRASHVRRSSARSDGSLPVHLDQTVRTPWAALAWSAPGGALLYASWGQGVELEAVPNRPSVFANAGQVLPALKSEQTEVGPKWQLRPRLLLSAAAFSIDKPYADNLPDADGLVLRVAGSKTARHRGLELTAAGQVDAQLSLQASLTLLDAKIVSAVDPLWVGQSVTNVPKAKLAVFADYKLRAVPQLSISTLLSAEQGKTVTIDGAVSLPAAWQLDAGLHYQSRLLGHTARWQLNLENLTDRRYWREAPTQYWGGVYLFPATGRQVRARLTLEF